MIWARLTFGSVSMTHKSFNHLLSQDAEFWDAEGGI